MDDQGLVPQAPLQEPEVAEQEAQDDALIEDRKIAVVKSHPAWEKVEEMLQESIDQLSARPSANLIAEEYKIEDQSRAKAGVILINLLDRIHNAIESVERTPRA